MFCLFLCLERFWKVIALNQCLESVWGTKSPPWLREQSPTSFQWATGILRSCRYLEANSNSSFYPQSWPSKLSVKDHFVTQKWDIITVTSSDCGGHHYTKAVSSLSIKKKKKTKLFPQLDILKIRQHLHLAIVRIFEN